MFSRILALMILASLGACGTLERRSNALNPGDTQEAVLEAMGEPDDRQFNENLMVWQYCKTGAGFGYHDFRTIWFRNGRVVGVTSYKDPTPGTGCTGHFRTLDWSAVPHAQ